MRVQLQRRLTALDGFQSLFFGRKGCTETFVLVQPFPFMLVNFLKTKKIDSTQYYCSVRNCDDKYNHKFIRILTWNIASFYWLVLVKTQEQTIYAFSSRET